MGRRATHAISACFALCLSCLLSDAAWGAAPLKYQFKGMTEPVYQFSIRAEYPSAIVTNSGTISYNIKAVDPANGQIQLSYSSQINEVRQDKQPANSRFPAIQMPSFPSPFAAMKPSPDILISSWGSVLRSNSNDDDAQLPHLLGYAWQLMLQPLAQDGADTWKSERSIRTYTKSNQRRWPPPPPWEREAETRVEHVARETLTFTRGQPKGAIVPIKHQYELVTDEKVGANPLLKQTGSGEILFDADAGLVTSIESKYDIESNSDNVTVRIPVTVSARLLSPEELAKLKAEREAAQAAANAAAEKRRAWEEGAKKAEEGTIRTPQIGGNGGGPFVRVEPQQRPVIGVRFTFGQWGGRKCVRQLDPLYEKPAEPVTGDGLDVLAKPGYAMGGLVVNTDTKTKELWAMQIIFMRLEDGKLNKADQYRSPWITDFNQGLAKLVLGGKGETVIGFFGRQGLNADAIGLVLKDPAYKPAAPGPAPDEVPADEQPAEKPATGKQPAAAGNPPAAAGAPAAAISSYWQTTSGQPSEILPQLKGTSSKDQDGNIVLGRGARLASLVSYRVPATFRIVCKSDQKDFRIGYAADQLIFNWEMNADELRVDGGPAAGTHKADFGRLPVNAWMGIEIVVTAQDMKIFVNGKRRYLGSGDFTGLSKPFSITAHGGELVLKSIAVVR